MIFLKHIFLKSPQTRKTLHIMLLSMIKSFMRMRSHLHKVLLQSEFSGEGAWRCGIDKKIGRLYSIFCQIVATFICVMLLSICCSDLISPLSAGPRQAAVFFSLFKMFCILLPEKYGCCSHNECVLAWHFSRVQGGEASHNRVQVFKY